jgi:hypothetical protein
MKRKVSVAMAAGVGAACLWLFGPHQARSAPPTKHEVRQLEVGWTLGTGGLKARFTLATGQAVDYRTEDPRDAERLLQAAQALAAGHARMFAEVEENAVRGVQLAIRTTKTDP